MRTWLAILVAVVLAACNNGQSPQVTDRVIVLGFDGMDPALAREWIADGSLPNLRQLAADGVFQPLPTSLPAQSPVAWSDFATGGDASVHGIYDFLRRDRGNYKPRFSFSGIEQPAHSFDWGDYRIPLGIPEPVNYRKGVPFWLKFEQSGGESTVEGVPVTYPPDPVHEMISGMGVPDLAGTQGTYSFYTTQADAYDHEGGRVIPIKVSAGIVETELLGPQHPLIREERWLSLPLKLSPIKTGVNLELGGEARSLQPGEWSDWLPVSFPVMPMLTIHGMVRVLLVSGFPDVRLYVSPIHADPLHADLPISSPPGFAKDLAGRIGRFHTLGMAEETWSLNDERINDQDFLQMNRIFMHEREQMLYEALQQSHSRLIVSVFVQVDRISHMFWRTRDPLHARHADTEPASKNAIHMIYQESDRIVGEVRKRMRAGDKLIVLSDHGFAPYRRSVHLNRWLLDNGYLKLKRAGKTPSATLDDIDWSATRAYAIGLNGIYLNLRGREAEGIVEPQQAAALKQELSKALLKFNDPSNGEAVLAAVHDTASSYSQPAQTEAPDLIAGYRPGFRASWETALGQVPDALVSENRSKWSGDHCIEPSFVPGVLFVSFKPPHPVPGISGMARLIESALDRGDKSH